MIEFILSILVDIGLIREDFKHIKSISKKRKMTEKNGRFKSIFCNQV
jgi:hypothetical protein